MTSKPSIDEHDDLDDPLIEPSEEEAESIEEAIEAAEELGIEIEPPPSKRRMFIRLGALAVVLIGAWALGEVTGLNAYMTQENIQAAMAEAGWWGILLYIAAFAVGNLVQIPGWVFIVTAVVAYGPLEGIGVALLGGLIAVTTSFVIVRTIGGKPLAAVKKPLMVKLLSKLDDHPFWSVVGLRLVFMTSPPLNYALALSSLSFRNYIVGSAVGLIVPITVAALIASYFVD